MKKNASVLLLQVDAVNFALHSPCCSPIKNNSKPVKNKQKHKVQTKRRFRGESINGWVAVSYGDSSFNGCKQDLLLGPFVLTTDLLLLLGGEIVLDVERLADLLRRLALDHVGNRLASNIKKGFDVEVVGSLYEC
jgi:hypothetical protein